MFRYELSDRAVLDIATAYEDAVEADTPVFVVTRCGHAQRFSLAGLGPDDTRAMLAELGAAAADGRVVDEALEGEEYAVLAYAHARRLVVATDGSYLRVTDEDGEEIAYWDLQEFIDDPEEVVTAVAGALLGRTVATL